MEKRSVQIVTICDCIDHCFAFSLWCEDFARHVDPDDMLAGLDRAFDVVSDATRLLSFLALRKLDDFLRATKPKQTDLIALDLGMDASSVLGAAGVTFLTPTERDDINTGAAHLTENLSLDPDSEIGLFNILDRSMPVFSRLLVELRKADTAQEASHALDRTDALIKHRNEVLAADAAAEAAKPAHP